MKNTLCSLHAKISEAQADAKDAEARVKTLADEVETLNREVDGLKYWWSIWREQPNKAPTVDEVISRACIIKSLSAKLTSKKDLLDSAYAEETKINLTLGTLLKQWSNLLDEMVQC